MSNNASIDSQKIDTLSSGTHAGAHAHSGVHTHAGTDSDFFAQLSERAFAVRLN